MPVISYFFGIYIRMYHDDHNPPHFHVEYQGHEALIAIEDGKLLEGHLPGKALKLVQDWAEHHRGELQEDWQLAVELKPLQRIAGADND
ncbi:DUF4160 domain-containing protein [Methylomonas rapida]|uniref:DUF4160 domain-containing protein n=1 Tax=Methylomonas rapida TaxID=2963939 RepID=A0ABY7GQF0_9GAMM|nr:DUF4160 domain-containing protein [Methylomonas rapida]WAR46723.1 DUF4160 domain-containing protein [Methylomonas rapida]